MSLNGLLSRNNPSRKIPYRVEFDETPRFCYPRVAIDTWIDFSSQVVELRSSECWENLPFCFFFPFLSLFLYPISFLFFSPVCFPSFSFLFSFLFSLSYPPPLFSFCLLLSSYPFHFPFSLFLFHFLFSLIFSFLSFSLFSSLSLIFIHRIVQKVGETSPHFPPCCGLLHKFSLFS